VLTVTGNVLTTYTENWLNVDTVEIVSTTANPVNWGSGTLYMDNVTINQAVPAPLPAGAGTGFALLGSAGALFGATGLLRRRRRGRIA